MRRPNTKCVGAMAMLVHVVSVQGKLSLSNMLSVQVKTAILLQLPGPILHVVLRFPFFLLQINLDRFPSRAGFEFSMLA